MSELIVRLSDTFLPGSGLGSGGSASEDSGPALRGLALSQPSSASLQCWLLLGARLASRCPGVGWTRGKPELTPGLGVCHVGQRHGQGPRQAVSFLEL